MEKIIEIFNSIKERISNPLIFSFISSWLILNWPITICLIWYDTKQIQNEGYSSIFEFIKDKINTTDSLFNPFYFAISYTFLMPVIKIFIKAFYSWTSKLSENWNLKILDGGKISINTYLNLRADHEKRSKILEEVIAKESTYLEDYNKANTELFGIKNHLNEVTERLNVNETYFKQLQDYRILDGTWEVTFDSPTGGQSKETAFIDSGKYYTVTTFGNKVQKFEIRDFYYDNRSGKVFFIKELVPNEKTSRNPLEHFTICRLNFEGKNLLIGHENGRIRIQYSKK